MWQIWTSGILGLWVILLAFLDFSSTLTTFFLVITGAVLAALNFWLLSFIKTPERRHPDSEILPSVPSELALSEADDAEVEIEEENESAQEPEDNVPQNN